MISELIIILPLISVELGYTFLLWPLYLSLTLGLHGLITLAGNSLDSLFAYINIKEDFWVWGLKEKGRHFDSLTGTFFFSRLPPSKLFQVWDKRDGVSWGLPLTPSRIVLETAWGSSFSIHGHPSAYSSPSGKKEGKSHLSNNFIHKNSQLRRHDNCLFLWFMYFFKSAL